jgi:hypothetical protein
VRTHPAAVLIPLVLTGGLLSGCGSSGDVPLKAAGPSPSAAGASPTRGANGVSAPIPAPCTLLTQVEANTIADFELQPGVEANGLCQWTSDPYGGTTAQVEVITGDGAHKALEIDRDTLGHTFTQPTGIADEAWQEDNQIFVRKGKNWFTIRLVRLEDPAGFVEPLQTGARQVVARMP